MRKRKFRTHYNPAEALAINPSALNLTFLLGGVKENELLLDCISVVYASGPLEHHESVMFDSYESIVERIEEAFADDDSKAVVLCLDSPGGDASGATEANKRIRELRKNSDKPIFAYSNEQMYSAAYSLGSACDEIWLPGTGGVGSVGVICAIADKTQANKKAGLLIELITTGKRKADSQEDRVLTDDIRNTIQARVNHLGKHFFSVVAKGRGMSPKAVEALQAGVFLGKEAVKVGLADGVAGWYSFLNMVAASVGHTETAVKPKATTDNVPQNTDKENASMRASILKLTKAKTKALDAFNAAAKDKKATDEDKQKLLVKFEAAVSALAAEQAKTKYKKTEKTETEETDDEDDDEEEEEEDDEEEEEDDDDDTDDEDDDDDEEEDEKSSTSKAIASIRSKSSGTAERLFSACAKLTGTKNVSKMLGALTGLQASKKANAKQEKRLAKLEQSNRKDSVDSIINAAIQARKIAPMTNPSTVALHQQGMQNPKWLKGYLTALPSMVRASEEISIPDLGGVAPTLGEMGLNADQQKILQQAANGVTETFDEFAAKVAGKIKGAVAPKF